MESIVAQRIKSVLESKQISISAFSKIIGMQQVTCNRQIRGDQAVSLGLIEGFLKEFDEISAEWLLRGKGEMILREDSTPAPVSTVDHDELISLRAENRVLRELLNLRSSEKKMETA